jgi:hypothetical protein
MKTIPYERIGKQEYKLLMSRLAGIIPIASNALYSPVDMARVILKASIEKEFVGSVCGQMRNSGKVVPGGNDIFYHLTGKEIGIHGVYSFIDSMIDMSVRKARRSVSFRMPLPVAIDFHDIPYYGNAAGELAEWVIGCKSNNGTNKCFRFITAHIVVGGRRFTVAALPVSVFDSIPELLGRLIAIAGKRIRIKYAFLDRGFYSVGAIKKLYELHVRFVMPVIKHGAKRPEKDMRMLLRKHLAGNGRFSYNLGNLYNNETFTVVAVEGKDGDVFGFATNTKLPAGTIGNWYKKRWGIETGYRMKEKFRARTCARKSPAVRELFNMLPFVIYNLWALVNAALGRTFRNIRPRITAYEFWKRLESMIESLVDHG